nr:hypothetical protein [Tanacetum cinerariifolium]
GTATGLAIDKGMQTGLAMTLTIEGLEGALLKLPPMILSWKECISLRSLPFIEDNAVIKETSLSDSLDVVHARV